VTDGQDLEQRVDDLLSRLPIGEKVALMFHTMAVIGDGGDGFEGMPLPSLQTLLDLGLTHFNLLGASPDGRRFADWANGVQRRAMQRPHPVPVTFSTDPRHHFTDNPLAQMMAGAYSRWPEPLGLAAIGSADRVREFADIARPGVPRGRVARRAAPAARPGHGGPLAADQRDVRRGRRSGVAAGRSLCSRTAR
jgi:beta-glucosidase